MIRAIERPLVNLIRAATWIVRKLTEVVSRMSADYVRPLRTAYVHDRCQVLTVMRSVDLARDFARDPKKHAQVYCCACDTEFPVDEFFWAGEPDRVGS